MTTTVRPAQASDEAALLDIHLATWTSQVSPDGAPDPTAAFLDNDTNLADVLVLDDGQRAVGYVRLVQRGPLPSHAHVLTINGLAVAPDMQGTGHGRALILAALDEAERRAARKVSLRVLAHNERARRLYASCGFAVEGVLRQEFMLEGQYTDDLFLAYYLDKQDAP